jgi:hypothetical protein
MQSTAKEMAKVQIKMEKIAQSVFNCVIVLGFLSQNRYMP